MSNAVTVEAESHLESYIQVKLRKNMGLFPQIMTQKILLEAPVQSLVHYFLLEVVFFPYIIYYDYNFSSLYFSQVLRTSLLIQIHPSLSLILKQIDFYEMIIKYNTKETAHPIGQKANKQATTKMGGKKPKRRNKKQRHTLLTHTNTKLRSDVKYTQKTIKVKRERE